MADAFLSLSVEDRREALGVAADLARAEGTPFVRLNQLYYSPLCLLIGAHAG